MTGKDNNQKALASKWRPLTFDTLIGQSHVVTTLQNALNKSRLHHAYLFTGTRGVGKTTLARIFAKCLNCESGITATPCGTCNHCREIDAGRFPDLYEVDAASRTKVEDTRELLNNVQYAPTKGRFKIYLIDEVHMLSTHSFNALLKTLEEPPAHVKFLFATTDPQKLPSTVLSRCLQFQLTQLAPDDIANHLQHILTQEKIHFEAEALSLIAQAAKGSVRDALSLLDQGIAFSDSSLTQASISTMLGTIDRSILFSILEALHDDNINHLIELCADIQNKGMNYSDALAEILSLLHQIAVTQLAPDALTTSPEIAHYTTQFSQETIQLYYQIGLHGQRDLAFNPNPRTGFEMTLLRMSAFQESAASISTTPPAKSHKPTATAGTHTPVTASKPKTPTVATAPQEKFTFNTNMSWEELLNALHLTGPTLALAVQCSMLELTDSRLHLCISPKHKPMLHDKHIKRINEALYSAFNIKILTDISVEKHSTETPADVKDRLQKENATGAEQSLQADNNVQHIVKNFNATILKDTIEADL